MQSAFCRYTFPFESQALYTQDAPVAVHADFAERTFALHRTLAPAGVGLGQHFASSRGADDDASLVFELFNCSPSEDEDELVAVGSLPVDAVLDAAEGSLAEMHSHEVRNLQQTPRRTRCNYARAEFAHGVRPTLL